MTSLAKTILACATALVAASCLFAPEAAHAQVKLTATAEERWLILPVLAAESTTRDTLAFTEPFEQGLESAGKETLRGSAAAALFESNHSAEPVELNDDEMTRLLRRVSDAARHLALGDLVQAQQDMEGVYALSGPARDFLNREAARARKIFENCLTAAYLWERSREHQRALRQMLDCSRSFPGFRPEGRAYPPELRDLFAQATLRLGQMKPTTLLVQSGARTGCGVRLNGIEVGKSPMSFSDVRSGMTRVQLECDEGQPGRIHEVELAPGDNLLTIDPAFDRAVSTRTTLSLAYKSREERASRADTDARIIAESLETPRVVQLWIWRGEAGDTVDVRVASRGRSRSLAELTFHAGKGYEPAALLAVVAKLLREDEIAAPLVASTESPDEPSRFSSAYDDYERDEGEPVASETHLAAGIPLALAGGAGVIAGWVLYAERQDLRRPLYSDGIPLATLDEFHDQGTRSLLFTSLGAGLLAVSDYFWLPTARDIPAWSWGVGAAGLALAATGAGYVAFGTQCDIRDVRVDCQAFTADAQFGPTLVFNALPLLAVPLTYVLRRALRTPDVDFALRPQIDHTQAGLTVQGSFL